MKTRKFVLRKTKLSERASELTALANQLGMIERLFESLEYSRVNGDGFVIQHQISKGLLDDLGENLSEIEGSILRISNDICPNVEA